jgi:hypothetical protein
MAGTAAECESFFEGKVNSMLVTTSWIDGLKDCLGINAVSQIWGEVPAWYMWLSGAQGAYRLELAHAMTDENSPANRRGFFYIKCYPFEGSTVFDSFSFEEQMLRRSHFFDDTHTPRFEQNERIADSLFNVAAMEYHVNQDDTMACITLDSLDTLRCVYPEETVQHYDLIGKKRRYQAGEIGRTVPGWQLGYPVFDRLLCMYALYSKAKPIRVRITRSAGFEYVHGGKHTFDCLDAPDTQRWTASICFASPDPCNEGIHQHGTDFPAPEEEADRVDIILDRRFPCGHYQPIEKMASTQVDEYAPINPLWWSLAETAHTSSLASTCGCH